MLKLLVGRAGGDEEAFAVSGCETADDARAGDGAVADGDDVLELGFEDAVRGVSTEVSIFAFLVLGICWEGKEEVRAQYVICAPVVGGVWGGKEIQEGLRIEVLARANSDKSI